MRICERNHAFDLEMKSHGKGFTGLLEGGRGQTSTPGLSNAFDYTKLVVLLKWFLVISWPVKSYTQQNTLMLKQRLIFIWFLAKINSSVKGAG